MSCFQISVRMSQMSRKQSVPSFTCSRVTKSGRKEIVSRDNLITVMITHNMADAIRVGNRLIMMHEGQIVVDVKGEEKKKLTIEQLLQMFEESSGSKFTSDKVMLSK